MRRSWGFNGLDGSTSHYLGNALADIKAKAARLLAWILVKPGADSKGQGCAVGRGHGVAEDGGVKGIMVFSRGLKKKTNPIHA